jgi:hypothetical protein
VKLARGREWRRRLSRNGFGQPATVLFYDGAIV